MKKLISYGAAIAAIVSMFVMSGVATAASPHPHRGDVTGATPDTFNAAWVTGVSSDGGAKGQSIELGTKMDDPTTDFAFYSFPHWWDQNLSDVKKIRADFMAGSGTVNTAGSPRFSLELDLPGNGIGTVASPDGDVVIYLDPSTCSVPAGGGWVFADFTGALTNCTIFDSTGASYSSDGSMTAWSKVVAAYPGAKVWFMFLIQDATTGVNYVDRIMLDNSFFTKQP